MKRGGGGERNPREGSADREIRKEGRKGEEGKGREGGKLSDFDATGVS